MKSNGICHNFFSMVELLVVISIIAVLTSLLLPALNKAKESARTIQCAGNEKQHAMATASYVNDYDNWLLISALEGGNAFEWKREISPYLGIKTVESDPKKWFPAYHKGVFLCPDWKIDLGALDPTYRVWEGGYGWNQNIGTHDGATAMTPRHKLSQIQIPSETILSGDTTDWVNNNKYSRYSALFIPHWEGWGPNPAVGNRHKKGINMTYADGHVQWDFQNTLRNGVNGDRDYYYKATK